MKKFIKLFSCIILSIIFLIGALPVYAADPGFTKEDVYKNLIKADIEDLQKKYNVNNVNMDIFSDTDWKLLLDILWKSEVDNQQDDNKIPKNIDRFLEDIFPQINKYFIASGNSKTVGDCLDIIYAEAEKAGYDVSANRKSHENEVFYDNSTLPVNNVNSNTSVNTVTDKTEKNTISSDSQNSDSKELTQTTQTISDTDDENYLNNKVFYIIIIAIVAFILVGGIVIVMFVKKND